jgi:hypothetical protein
VLKAKRATPSLIKRVLGQYDLSRVKAISWGISNEDEAVKAFEAAMQKNVQSSGLWLMNSGILGASPDGLVENNALLEVKCPYTQRNMSINEAVAGYKDFCLTKEDGKFKLKTDHVYRHQVQGQLHIANKEICYFVTWTTKQTVIIIIKKE